jgi:hypothetical protein
MRTDNREDGTRIMAAADGNGARPECERRRQNCLANRPHVFRLPENLARFDTTENNVY